jgi:hypothetical protein
MDIRCQVPKQANKIWVLKLVLVHRAVADLVPSIHITVPAIRSTHRGAKKGQRVRANISANKKATTIGAQT